MKKKIFCSLFLICILLLVSTVVVGFWDWKTYESDNFVIFYPEGYERKAEESLYYLEKYRDQIIELTGNEMESKIHVSLEDIGLYTNGYADPINNKIGIFTNNPSSYSNLNNYENWLRLVNIHELIHIGQMNNTSDLSSFNSKLFGNLFSPNLHSPLWLIEGIAVYGESQTSPYEGRLNGGYYDGVLSVRAQADQIPSLSEITYSHDHFPMGQQYLYGGTFFRYLAEQYGEDKFAELFDTYGSYFWATFHGNLFPMMGLDKAATEVYGKNFETLYLEWQEYERERNKDWRIDGERVLATDRGHISKLTAYNNKMYYFKSYNLNPYPLSYSRKNQLIEYDLATDKKRVLKETIGDNFGTIEIKDNKLYYLLGEATLGYPNVSSGKKGVIASLYSYDLETERSSKIFSDEIRDFVVLDTGEIIYAKANKQGYGSEILSYKEGQREKIGTIPQLISEMKLYQDEIVIVSKGNLSSWGINYLKLDNLEIEPIIATPWPEKQINIIDNQLYFTANYDGYEGIYQYDLANQNLTKMTTGGYATNGFLTDEGLYFLTYDLDGMAIYKNDGEGRDYLLAETEFEQKQLDLDFTKLDIELTEINSFAKNLSYLARPSMRLFPYFLVGNDALGLNYYQIEYSQYGGLDFVWINRMLDPLTISLANRMDEDGRSNHLNLAYPLYQSYLDGLTRLELDLSTDFDSVLIGNRFNFNYPNHNLALYLQGDVNSYDYKGQLGYRYLLNKGSIGLRGGYFAGLERGQDVREFELEGDKSNGNQISLEYTHKLFELRKGLWNPNLFVGDVYGNAFVDYLNFDEEQLSGGYELLFEMGAANWFHFVPRVGISFKESNFKPYFGLETRF